MTLYCPAVFFIHGSLLCSYFFNGEYLLRPRGVKLYQANFALSKKELRDNFSNARIKQLEVGR